MSDQGLHVVIISPIFDNDNVNPVEVSTHTNTSADRQTEDCDLRDDTLVLNNVPYKPLQTLAKMFRLPGNFKDVSHHCKYDCNFSTLGQESLSEHETHCTRQFIECPVDNCKLISELVDLRDHIFQDHDNNIDIKAETTGDFTIFFYGLTFEPGNPKKKISYMQLVDDRLFITSVTVDFKNLLVLVYSQYVNDDRKIMSKVAIEACCDEGMPQQWTGVVYPLTVKSDDLIRSNNCLKIQLDTCSFLSSIRISTKVANFPLVAVGNS